LRTPCRGPGRRFGSVRGEAEAAFSKGLQSSPPPDVRVMLHFRRGNARDGLGQCQRALFDYNRVR